MRRRARLAALVACVLAAACGGEENEAAPPAPPPASTEPSATGAVETEDRQAGPLRLEQVADGFDAPTHVTAAPGDDERLYVVERPGTVRVLEGGRIREEPFLDLTGDVTSGGEQGLLSLAFHPAYAENRRLFVNYTNLDGDTRVVELRASRDGMRVDPGFARELLAVDQPYANHNGGQLAFGPEGLLYVGMGDGGSGGDPENRAQDLSTRLGKLLRLDVDAGGTDWELVAYGLRNPWRFSFDRETGDLLLADVGQSGLEEVNRVAWPPGELLNFGWRVFEGTDRFTDEEPNPEGRLVEPVHVYGRDAGCSITGGFVYRGRAVAGAAGRYFFGDYCSGTVWSFPVEEDRIGDVRTEPFEVPELSSFGEDAAGELYVVSLGGTLYRLAS